MTPSKIDDNLNCSKVCKSSGEGVNDFVVPRGYWIHESQCNRTQGYRAKHELTQCNDKFECEKGEAHLCWAIIVQTSAPVMA